jgi:four helix bundle protein
MTSFDHERLDVYRLSLQFVAWSENLLRGNPRINPSARSQLARAADSIPQNIAEGNGKRPGSDRKHFLEIARGSASECAATMDILAARRLRSLENVREGKTLLHRIISMLIRLAPPGG